MPKNAFSWIRNRTIRKRKAIRRIQKELEISVSYIDSNFDFCSETLHGDACFEYFHALHKKLLWGVSNESQSTRCGEEEIWECKSSVASMDASGASGLDIGSVVSDMAREIDCAYQFQQLGIDDESLARLRRIGRRELSCKLYERMFDYFVPFATAVEQIWYISGLHRHTEYKKKRKKYVKYIDTFGPYSLHFFKSLIKTKYQPS